MAAVDCIIKLGGSALTEKDQLETLKPGALQKAAALVSKVHGAGERRCIVVHGAGAQTYGTAILTNLNRFDADQGLHGNPIDAALTPMIKGTYHVEIKSTTLGAHQHKQRSRKLTVALPMSEVPHLKDELSESSFGHFQAKQHDVACGSSTGSAVSPRLRRGLCLTRLSVTKLNHLVTDQLVKTGVPAVGLSPFGTWKTAFKNVSQAGIDTVKDVLDSGYVPVLHGDCALDLEQHCCILSGDTIIEMLAQKFSPRRVVFLTDVSGVYSCPPDKPGSRLINSITIGPDGNMEPPVLTSVLPHDTTGGVSLKLQSAVNIVSRSYGGIPVLICKLDSEAAERACLTGELEEGEGTKLFFKDV